MEGNESIMRNSEDLRGRHDKLFFSCAVDCLDLMRKYDRIHMWKLFLIAGS